MSDRDVADATLKQLRLLVPIIAGVLLIAVISAGLGALVMRSTLKRVENNSDEIAKNEHEDITASREALYRLCERQNLARAGHHWAYGQAVLTTQQRPPERIVAALATEPALAYFLAQSAKQSAANLRRTQHTLPILDCSPNLSGEPAMPLSRGAQERYVVRWAKGKLDPTPDPTRPLNRR